MLANHRHRRGPEVDVAPERLDVLLVRPRPHQDTVVETLLDPGEGTQVRARVRVEPAALLEDRNVHGVEAVPELLPVRVVRLMLPPCPPVGHLPADRHLVEIDQRQVTEDPLVEEERRRARAGHERHRAVPQGGGAERQRELEGTAGEVPVPEVVVVNDVRRDADEVRVPEVRELPLDGAAVAPAPGADAAVAPLLAGRPCERVLRVDAVEDPRVEQALRLVAAADVDDDRGVPALGVEGTPRDEAVAGRLVRRPLDDRRERPVGEGKVDVGGDRDAVAHRHPPVVQQARIVARLGRRVSHGPRRRPPRSAFRRSGTRRDDRRRSPSAAAPRQHRSRVRSGSASGSGSRSAG